MWLIFGSGHRLFMQSRGTYFTCGVTSCQAYSIIRWWHVSGMSDEFLQKFARFIIGRDYQCLVAACCSWFDGDRRGDFVLLLSSQRLAGSCLAMTKIYFLSTLSITRSFCRSLLTFMTFCCNSMNLWLLGCDYPSVDDHLQHHNYYRQNLTFCPKRVSWMVGWWRGLMDKFCWQFVHIGLDRPMPYNERLRYLQLQPLGERRLIQDLTTLYRIFTKDCMINPKFLPLITRSPTNPNRFPVPYSKMNCKYYSFFLRTLRVYNQVSKKLVNIQSCSHFKNSLRQLNLERYYRK